MIKTISIVTLYPEFIRSFKHFGPLARLEKNKLFKLNIIHLREYGLGKQKQVDDRPYGGGDGMVLRAEPIVNVIEKGNFSRIIYTSPAGKKWTHSSAKKYSTYEGNLLIICGHFSGIDQRIIDHYVDDEVSIGDFILSGGELPALLLVDSIIRLIPGALGNNESAHYDSFAPGFSGKLEHPLYTRPETFEGISVPPVLLSGNHQKIALWKQTKSLEKTNNHRKDLLQKT